MPGKRIIALLILSLAQPVMADSAELEALKLAAQTARITMNDTASKMTLLVAEIDTQELEPAPQTAEPVEPQAEMAEPEPEPSVPEPAPVTGEVSRSMFATAIENREPVDDIVQIDNNTPHVYFFTELRDMKGQQVTHRWIYQGEVMGEVTFQVGGPRWRVHSSKNLMPEWTGMWEVQVVDAAGNVLTTRQIEVQQATVAPATPEITEDRPESGESQ